MLQSGKTNSVLLTVQGLTSPRVYRKFFKKKLMCLCVYVWTHMCMLCGSMGTCVPWHIYGARRQFSGVYSTLLCQGVSCFYSTARTRLWSSISSPVAVPGLQSVTAHLTVYMGSGHWIWIVRLEWQVLLPAKAPPHLPFGTFLLVSYCLQQRGLEYFGCKH